MENTIELPCIELPSPSRWNIFVLESSGSASWTLNQCSNDCLFSLLNSLSPKPTARIHILHLGSALERDSMSQRGSSGSKLWGSMWKWRPPLSPHSLASRHHLRRDEGRHSQLHCLSWDHAVAPVGGHIKQWTKQPPALPAAAVAVRTEDIYSSASVASRQNQVQHPHGGGFITGKLSRMLCAFLFATEYYKIQNWLILGWKVQSSVPP